MAKFRKRKFFKKQHDHNKVFETEHSEDKKPEAILQENSFEGNNSSIKNWIKSGTKYAYILVISAFLSGIFTPFLLTNADFSNVIMGILAILVGVAGGILIFKGSTQEKSSPKLILIGLSLAVISLYLIFALGNFVPEWQIPSISS